MDGIGSLSISEQRLVDALREAQQETSGDNPEGALTTEQLCMITGWNVSTTRKHLKMLKRRKIIQTTRVRQTDLADRNMPVYAYRIMAEVLEGDNEVDDERQ